MNKAERKELNAFIGKLEEINARITEIKDNEQDKFDDMSERAQDSDRGNKLADEIGKLETIGGDLESAISYLQELSGE